MKHTAAPWKPLIGAGAVLISTDHCVATVPKRESMTMDEWYANTLLISAAPELLEAVKALRENHAMMNPHHEDMCELCRMADLAIKKATDWREE